MQLTPPVDTATRTRRRDREPPWYRSAASLLPNLTGRWIDLGDARDEFLARAAARAQRRVQHFGWPLKRVEVSS